jgi:hypothetical protein
LEWGAAQVVADKQFALCFLQCDATSAANPLPSASGSPVLPKWASKSRNGTLHSFSLATASAALAPLLLGLPVLLQQGQNPLLP